MAGRLRGMVDVVAIDGPAGAGKSTVAKAIANQLGFLYLDTGAMYRCAALLAIRNQLSSGDGEKTAELLRNAEIRFESGNPQQVFLNGENVTGMIRTPEIAEMASALSAFTPVRRILATRQREICLKGNVVLEGRDTTTVVCPEAKVKIYLTASADERANRRLKDLRAMGDEKTTFEELKEQIEIRDRRDSTREDSPLTVAPEAIVVDTDRLTPEQVIEKIISIRASLD